MDINKTGGYVDSVRATAGDVRTSLARSCCARMQLSIMPAGLNFECGRREKLQVRRSKQPRRGESLAAQLIAKATTAAKATLQLCNGRFEIKLVIAVESGTLPTSQSIFLRLLSGANSDRHATDLRPRQDRVKDLAWGDFAL